MPSFVQRDDMYIIPSTPLTCFGVGGSATRLYYLDGGGHVHELAWDNGWTDTDITFLTNSTAAASFTTLTSFGVGGSATRLYYLDASSNAHEIAWDNGWAVSQLPITPTAGSALACFGYGGSDTRLYYLGELSPGNFYVNELSWQNGWVNTPL